MSRYWRWLAGVVAAVVAVYFIWFLLKTFKTQDLSSLASLPSIISIVVAAVLYATIIPVSGWAWSLLLRRQGESWSVMRLASIMGVTQIAKYIPGNVAQHVGRATLSLSHGMKLKPFTASIVHESMLAVAGSVAVGISLIGLSPLGLGKLSAEYRDILWIAGIAVVGGVFMLAAGSAALPQSIRRHAKVESWLHKLGPSPGLKVTIYAFLAYCLNYLVIGAGIWGIAYASGTIPSPNYALLTAAFSLAWVLGFVTPGAPAGLGVREGVMALVLKGAMPDHQLLTLIFAARLSTMIGDGICFIFGMIGMRCVSIRAMR
jgi:uncharacterized membrane protein YbhN (UPF0104 family)